MEYLWSLKEVRAYSSHVWYVLLIHVDHLHPHLIWVLRLQLRTMRPYLADSTLFRSKSEFVIYKLKEMGKVSDKDIMQICKKFDRLDTGNCGKITLGDLMEGHHWVATYQGGFSSFPSRRGSNMQLRLIVFSPGKYTHEVPNRAREFSLTKTFEGGAFFSILYRISAYGSFSIL